MDKASRMLDLQRVIEKTRSRLATAGTITPEEQALMGALIILAQEIALLAEELAVLKWQIEAPAPRGARSDEEWIETVKGMISHIG